MNPGPQQALARALGYPYARPAQRYLFSNGECRAWQGALVEALPSLTPVLAVGSNAAPEQLRRKFGQDHDDIPVTMGWLDDHDVVYGAYLTSYGSLPATLVDSPGTRVAMAITWLSESALAQMHATEAVGSHTDYGVLSGLSLSPELGLTSAAPTQVFTWRCRLGEFAGPEGTPVALQALSADNRRWPALSQEDVQRGLHRMLVGEQAERQSADRFGDWVLSNILEPGHRDASSLWSQRRCLEIGLRHFESLGA